MMMHEYDIPGRKYTLNLLSVLQQQTALQQGVFPLKSRIKIHSAMNLMIDNDLIRSNLILIWILV